MELLPQLFQDIEDKFTQHLELSDNERILFSGAFGIGKTTFINHYFEDGQGKDYNVIHLYPVNYSVLKNEDIFTYIKYDIIYEMLEKKLLILESVEFNSLNKLPDFVLENLGKISSLFLLLVPKMGRQLFQLTEEIRSLHEKLLEYKKENNNKTSTSNVTELLDAYTKKDGELYEFNVTTLIIHDALNELKKNGKKNILIIDDLDRIDPNHIFRLFNVFAAHFDKKLEGNKNKFGFDHIIFVCDVQNIKNIYKHKYGINTDFNGYIDKFYSRKIFFFDNHENINSFLTSFFNEIQFIGDSDSHTKYLQENKFLKLKLVFIFTNFVLNKQINLRSLIRIYKKEFHLTYTKINLNNGSSVYDWQYSTFHFIRIILSFFVDYESFKNSLEKCSNSRNIREFKSGNNQLLYGELFMTLDLLKNKNELHHTNVNCRYLDHEKDLVITFTPYSIPDLQILDAKFKSSTNPSGGEKVIKIKDYFLFLFELVSILEERNYFS